MDDIERRLRIVVLRQLGYSAGICCGSAGGAVWGCCVCVRCGAFGDAFGSAGGAASVACSVCGNEARGKADFCVGCMNAFPWIYDLFDPSLLPSAIARLVSRSLQSRRAVVVLDDEVMG
ncbi:uncharacterized protein MONOS_11675 [Monocercomonoides exilis]|uniref:uncharacterized protein n=1 Tax=Monocercomonoides exilis TaxID=2049356 RepID=UPI003559F35A|nr:hypothetical protein MONOS_11675 [Monocercomonoides exilis]|eukprot:MONOS_11675.1-p1 / transcript=MONOS_11675.1 / gene=MONOS_11675 / organism=Monocercomonoides_exilis_PA203 / gene_product=unspecified product / transcript_product=unspecified product / location=Mono_scaffold00600:32599-33016(+) / protein_length=119 / sequence_SO=supercontig / SO=protein_coding / is_pseudo=false